MSITEIAPMADPPAAKAAPPEEPGVVDTIMTDDLNTASTNTDNAANDTKSDPSPPANHSKSHLPASLASLLPPTPRTPKEQETYMHRKAEIMRKFSLAQIQALYEEETAKLLDMLEEDRRSNEEVKKQIEILEKQRELERRIYSNLRGGKVKEKEEDGRKSDTEAQEQNLGRGEEGEVGEDGEDVKMEGGE